MEAVKETFDILVSAALPYITSGPVAVVLIVMLVASIMKRLVKVAIAIAIVTACVIALRYFCPDISVVENAASIIGGALR